MNFCRSELRGDGKRREGGWGDGWCDGWSEREGCVGLGGRERSGAWPRLRLVVRWMECEKICRMGVKSSMNTAAAMQRSQSFGNGEKSGISITRMTLLSSR